MDIVPMRVRAWGRAAARVTQRVLLVVFILVVAVLPLPMVPFMAFLIRPSRREDRTVEVMRKDGARR